MFYSHEILTSRKYGVATVWLVATLGAKSSLKRINRKQILDVDVTKACHTIIDPAAPMALRLQGNLLLGVSRVYLQQCGYILSDAQSAHTMMRMLLRSVQNTALDPDAGKARPEQLVLADDPSFLPEFALPGPELLAQLDLNFNIDIVHAGDSQSLTPFGSQQSLSSHGDPIGGLVLPTSSPDAPGGFRLEGDDGLGSAGGASALFGAGDMTDLLEPDFAFGDDGEMIDVPPRNALLRTPGVPGGATMPSDAGASARVRREHEEGQQAGAQIPADHMDVDLPILGDDLPEGEAFSSVGQHQTSEHSEQVQSTSTVSAPMRQRRRVVRIVPTDRQVELPNKELAAWNTNYLQNMKTATRQKLQGKATQQAKKNAEHYVWGGGLGGIGEDLLGTSGSHPFDMFTGDNFFELVTGVSRKKLAGKKHDRDSGIDDATQGESRSVRQKTGESENQLGRGMEDEGFFMPGGDEVDVELPREGATALDDEQIFSAMPWNISASKRGSSVVPQSGISGRLGMTGSIDQGKRGSRIISASPLLGRGQPSALDALRSLESDADHGYSGDDFALPEPSSEFPEPPAAPQTPTRVREALSAEGENFLTFVAEAIAEKRTRARADLELEADPLQAEAAADIEDVTFAELLSPADNTKVVACQGLMMVLGLGTKGMLDVQQLEHFGDISLKLSAKAKAAQVIEISDGVESDNEDTEDEPDNEEAGEEGEMRGQEGTRNEGHFEEQFAAGHTARGDDDHDSLYDD